MSEEKKDIGKIMEEMLNRPLELIEENKKLKKKIDKLQKENERYKKAIDNGEYTWKQKYEETFGYVKELIEEKERAISKLQKENKELKEENTILEGNKIGYKLAIQELEKTIDLIIDDLQDTENYFENMTNKEVREYYKKRKELKE